MIRHGAVTRIRLLAPDSLAGWINELHKQILHVFPVVFVCHYHAASYCVNPVHLLNLAEVWQPDRLSERAGRFSTRLNTQPAMNTVCRARTGTGVQIMQPEKQTKQSVSSVRARKSLNGLWNGKRQHSRASCLIRLKVYRAGPK